MLKGFRDFLLRGNVIDLAIGVVIGASFNNVVSALVKDLFTPFIAAILHTPNFSGLSFAIHGTSFPYGDFINNVISFLIAASAVYFLIVFPVHALVTYAKKNPPPSPPTTMKCPECLSDIPLGAKRCAHCTCVLAQDSAKAP